MAEHSLSRLGLPGGSEVPYSQEQGCTHRGAGNGSGEGLSGRAGSESVKVWGHESGKFQGTSGRYP